MSSTIMSDARRMLLATTAALSLGSAGAVLCEVPFAATAYAQSPSVLPPITINPGRSTTRHTRTSTSSPTPKRAPPAAAATPIDSAFMPADTATITANETFSRGLSTSDSASLINDIPGGATWGAGGVSGLPAINGMGADRVQVAVNGMLISPACPNEMNPPLSFVNPTMIAKMRTYMGIAPVSTGGDFIGGKIDVTTTQPQFAPTDGWVTTAMLSSFFRSNGNAFGVDASATTANKDTAVSYTGGWVRAGDYKAADGSRVKSTMFETQNHALSISKRTFGNLFTVQVGGQFIPYQGYVNQRMDMVYNRSLFINGRYEGLFDWGTFEASAFAHTIRHTMGFVAPDKTGNMPMDTKATDSGYSLKATITASARDVIRVGNELAYNQLNDWWAPVAGSMSPNTFINVNNGHRGRIGTFAEWERRWDRQWSTVVGIRNDVVWMNTGPVQGYNPMGYGADAVAFNARDHERTDVNLDGSGLIRLEPNQSSLFELGVARKTRSPNLYERYTWSTNAMAMNMIGWFGDGNGYVGNLDLKPEKAHTVSFTAAWHDPERKSWGLRVTPYLNYVQDYIDVDRCATASCLANRPTNLTERNNFVFLQFANHNARLYGVNVEAKLALWNNLEYGRGEFRGTLGYVRGERTDGIDLYRIMPINTKLAIDHTLGNWTNSIELQLVGAKNHVSEVRNELTTPAYALVNLRMGYQWNAMRIDFGIDNLFNQSYDLPLGGADLVDYRMTMGMMSMPVYGYGVRGPGRSFNGRMTMKF